MRGDGPSLGARTASGDWTRAGLSAGVVLPSLPTWRTSRRLPRADLVCLVDGMDVDALVVREGDRVVAAGRLVRNSQGDWFEPARWITGLERQVRPVSQGAVRVVGVDFRAVSGRFERDGAVEGWALVTGTWSGGQLEVAQQDDPPPLPDPQARWVTPPCPPPPGGWPVVIPRGDIHLYYDLGGLLETGAAVAVTLFRPGENQAVLVVAASDVAAVETQLRPQLGELLCIVPSRWTKPELDAVRGYLDAHRQQWNLLQWGPRNTADGQTQVAAQLVRVLPEIADWAASLPEGIVLLEPWLTRLRAGADASQTLDFSQRDWRW